MKPVSSFFLMIFCLSFMPCVIRAETSSPQPATQPSKQHDDYYEPLAILTRNCAGCHQAADHPGALFLNKARLTERGTQDLIIKLIETSQMPPAHRDFKKTSDGKKLLAWLKKERAKKSD